MREHLCVVKHARVVSLHYLWWNRVSARVCVYARD